MNYNVQIWLKPGTKPMEFSIEAANIHEASDKVHALKKFKADKACEIQIKGGEKKKPTVDPVHEAELPADDEQDAVVTVLYESTEAVQDAIEDDERNTSVLP